MGSLYRNVHSKISVLSSNSAISFSRYNVALSSNYNNQAVLVTKASLFYFVIKIILNAYCICISLNGFVYVY